jgi:hypothetical protein
MIRNNPITVQFSSEHGKSKLQLPLPTQILMFDVLETIVINDGVKTQIQSLDVPFEDLSGLPIYLRW